jgi:transposase
MNGRHARERVAGRDVRQAMIAACVRIMPAGKIECQCRTFEPSAAGRETLLEWLTASRGTHVAMAAAGVYRKPACNILSGAAFALIVANAAHIRNVAGRETAVNGAAWIAGLAAAG